MRCIPAAVEFSVELCHFWKFVEMFSFSLFGCLTTQIFSWYRSKGFGILQLHTLHITFLFIHFEVTCPPTIKVKHFQQFHVSGLIRHHRRKQSQQPLLEAWEPWFRQQSCHREWRTTKGKMIVLFPELAQINSVEKRISFLKREGRIGKSSCVWRD